jgi:hypothetical protein
MIVVLTVAQASFPASYDYPLIVFGAAAVAVFLGVALVVGLALWLVVAVQDWLAQLHPGGSGLTSSPAA